MVTRTNKKQPTRNNQQETTNKIWKFVFCIFFVSCVLWIGILHLPTANAAAGINKQINFQGKLVDNNGLNVADSTYTVVFSLYTVSSGGTATWTETDSVTTSNGIFQVALGAGTSLPGSVDFNTDTWYLGIQVGADAEMTPRVRFTAVPYAFNASMVNGLAVTNNGGNTLNIAANKTLTANDSTTFATNAITLGGGEVITFTASNALTLATTASTNVTLPTAGTLATLDGTEALTNKTITASGLVTANAGIVETKTISANSGTTNTVNALTLTTPIDSSGTNVDQGIAIVPSLGDSTNGTNTVNFIETDPFTAPPNGKVNINAISIGGLTGATGATERAISIGSGWDASLAFGAQSANDNTTQGAIQFASSGSGVNDCATGTAQGLVIKDQSGTQRGHFCFDNSNLEGFGLAWTASATDVAENYSDVANILTPGDLVRIDTSGFAKSVTKTIRPYEQLLFGIVSTQPGLLLSDVDESNGTTDLVHQKPIALTGRVPTHVNSENGPIAVGDFITSSSTPGIGMKATKPGAVVGQALEAFDGIGTGTIYVFTRAGYYNGKGDLSAQPNEPAQSELGASSSAVLSSAPQNFTLNSLSVLGLATVSADLRVTQNVFIEGVLHIADTLLTNNLVSNGLAQFFGQVIFRGGVSFEQTPIFPQDSGGFALVHAGQDHVDIAFTKQYTAAPVINATLLLSSVTPAPTATPVGYSYSIAHVTESGFTIQLTKPAASDTSFSWSALLIGSPMTFESSTTHPTPTLIPTLTIQQGSSSASSSSQ